MEIDDLFDDPVSRRWWLLNRALESAPLAEALQWARAVEDFLRGHSDEGISAANGRRPPDRRDASAAAPVGSIGSAGQTAGFVSFTDEFAVLASADDVVRFLSQRGNTVVREGEAYRVDGKVREDIDQLTERANRIRAHSALPLFQLMPVELVPNREALKSIRYRMGV